LHLFPPESITLIKEEHYQQASSNFGMIEEAFYAQMLELKWFLHPINLTGVTMKLLTSLP